MSNILEEIVERHPLEHSYAEDGRYAWPERWKEAKEAFAALEAKLEVMEMETLEICGWFELKTGHERAGWMPRKAAAQESSP